MRCTLVLLCFIALVSTAELYRYLDLTPEMAVLPRGPVPVEIASDIRCYEIIELPGDSMIVRGFYKGFPEEVFGIASEILMVSTDTLVTWDMGDFNYRIELNANGRPSTLTRFDTNGDVLPGSDGAAFIQWYRGSDDSSFTVVSLDSTFTPLPIKLKPLYSTTAAKLDEDGNLIQFTYGSRMAFGLSYQVDRDGRQLIRRAVDQQGDTVTSSDGVSEVHYSYDQLGNTRYTAYFDSDGNLMPSNYILPEYGNWEFNDDGVVLNGYNIAYIEKSYDSNCLYTSEVNIGLDGLPVDDTYGRARTVFEREIHGGVSFSAWFNAEGDRVQVGGIWATRRTFDDLGRVLQSSTYNSLDEISEYTGGFAYTRFSYTPGGQPELISYYDSSGIPVVNTVPGCHARQYSYTEFGEPTEIRFLDTEMKLMNNTAGYARVVYLYDSQNNLVDEILFDESGERLSL